MDIQLPQILFQIVNFSVVLGALTYLLYKPILKIFEERARRIEEGQQAAQAAIAQQQGIADLKAKTERQLKKDSARLLEEATKEAAAQKQELIAEARTKAQAEIESLRQKWNEEKARMLRDLNQQVVTAVITTSEKVLGQSLDTKAHAKLIDTELEKVLKSI